MRKLKRDEMIKIDGGSSLSSTLISALTRAGTAIMDIGRSLGSAIRRIYEGSSCPLE